MCWVQRYQALAALLEAYDTAQQLGTSPWEFAIEIDELRRAGVGRTCLRWLVWKGLAEHACEEKPIVGGARVFRPTGRMSFTRNTCFVLTKEGEAVARRELGRVFPSNGSAPVETVTCSTEPTSEPEPEAEPCQHEGRLVPKWDYELQELRLGRYLVKRFKVPAPNQERILAAFEEEGWPARIYDPLPPSPACPEQDPKRRLHDTIVSLNRHQIYRLIRFSGDGRGEGVRWELISTPDGES